ncbi:unnamed protein product [Diplocarpon coronariae]
MTGRVVIDPRTFNEEARARKESIAADEGGDDNVERGEKKARLPDRGEDRLVGKELDPRTCPLYVYGYSLEKKGWCKFLVDSITEVDWKKNAFDSLILPQPQKRLLRGLVSGHEYSDRARDEARLKGKGLVILLHGAPGSGKTQTAEMTVEHTYRPLLNISRGELGSYQHRIEIELKRLLTYASTFQAIVLIDEADVFLEARKSEVADQLSQNAMVACVPTAARVFPGRHFPHVQPVAVFDQAIKCRIHLALQYTGPGKGIRRLLWEKHLAPVPAEDGDLDFAETLDAVEHAEMNGREISNPITTARTLAKSESSKLKRPTWVTRLTCSTMYARAQEPLSAAAFRGRASMLDDPAERANRAVPTMQHEARAAKSHSALTSASHTLPRPRVPPQQTQSPLPTFSPALQSDSPTAPTPAAHAPDRAIAPRIILDVHGQRRVQHPQPRLLRRGAVDVFRWEAGDEREALERVGVRAAGAVAPGHARSERLHVPAGPADASVSASDGS